MYTRPVDALTILTQSYWMLSSARAGRSKEKITVEHAIKSVNVLEQNLGPHRTLSKAVQNLGDLIVQGKTKKPKQLPHNVLHITRGSNA